MILARMLRSNADYSRNLIQAAISGARSAQDEAFGGMPVGSLIARSAVKSWPLVVMGTLAGVLGARFWNKRKTNSDVAGALLGATLGLGTGMILNTRPVAQILAREAMKSVGAVRDANWLARNPVDFG
jgi:hypothetical protein